MPSVKIPPEFWVFWNQTAGDFPYEFLSSWGDSCDWVWLEEVAAAIGMPLDVPFRIHGSIRALVPQDDFDRETATYPEAFTVGFDARDTNSGSPEESTWAAMDAADFTLPIDFSFPPLVDFPSDAIAYFWFQASGDESTDFTIPEPDIYLEWEGGEAREPENMLDNPSRWTIDARGEWAEGSYNLPLEGYFTGLLLSTTDRVEGDWLTGYVSGPARDSLGNALEFVILEGDQVVFRTTMGLPVSFNLVLDPSLDYRLFVTIAGSSEMRELYAGLPVKIVPGEYVQEFPTLIKDSSIELVSPAVPPKAGIEPRQFWMFAAPPPPGYTYNQGKASDGSLRPDSLATFQNWKPLLQVKKPIAVGGGGSGGGSGGWIFISLEELLNGITGSISIPGDWTPVYDTDNKLVGYMAPPSSTGAGGSNGSWPKHYGPIAYMSYARFPDYPTEPNGYPITDEPRIWGEFDIPTLEGLRTFRFTFVKRGDGQWVRDGGGDPLPPYVVEDRRTTSRIAVLADFPGAPAVPGRPAEYRTNRHVGWNAGADSVKVHEGDCRVRFYHAIGVAGCVGLTPARERDVGDFTTIEYGFYVDLDAAGATRACVVERGRRVSAYFPCNQDTKFVIAREGNLVRYEIDGAVVAESSRLSADPLMVGSSLLVADDGVY